MKRLGVALLGAFAATCGGGSSPTSVPTPVPTDDSSAIVRLQGSNFDALVLGSALPSLVEFHSPT